MCRDSTRQAYLLINMFSTFRVARLVALKASLPMPATVQICRHANQDVSVWMGSGRGHPVKDNRKTDQDIFDEDLGMDAAEAKLESLLKEEKKRWKAAKFHKIRRQLSTRGAPERRLTWDAIEQIRYLKQECPQEWTVQALAESYSVSPDAISRILRSKFTPTPERKFKQDCKVLAMARQLSPGHGETDGSNKVQLRLPVPHSTKPARLILGNTDSLACHGRGALVKMDAEKDLAPADGVPSMLRGMPQMSAGLSVAQSQSWERLHEKEGPMDIEEQKGLDLGKEEEESWDGVVFTEQQLEDLIYSLREKPSTVEQKGREFFDSEGNFLYRI